MKFKFAIGFFLIIQVFTLILWGKTFSVSTVFSNNMVLQRGANVAVWGLGAKGDRIELKFADITLSASVDSLGKWMAYIPPMDAGGPYQLHINNKQDSIFINNILVGDVWLVSGQSNMQMALSWGVNNKELEIQQANYPSIRLLSVADDLDNIPQPNIKAGQWLPCTPESVKDFSAIGYFFARKLHAELHVPIGIINSSWGGTDIQAWMSSEALQTYPDYRNLLPEIVATTADFSTGYEKFQETNKLRDSIILNSVNGIKNKVFSSKYNDNNWQTMTLPCKWSDYGLTNFFGFVWFRKTIWLKSVPKNLSMLLGTVSNENIAYVNGVPIFKTDSLSNIVYNIPAKLLRKGKNVITLRVLGRWGIGGFDSSADKIYLASADRSFFQSLASQWKYNAEIEPKTPSWNEFYNYPSFIYNAKIAPLFPFGLKGILWYQGENNTKKPAGYAAFFSELVNDWRIKFKQGNLPVIFGQLSNYNSISNTPQESKIAELRNEQTKGLLLPTTAMVLNIDLGPVGGDVHFKNKQKSAARFAAAALGLVYGQDIAYKCPMFRSASLNGQFIHVVFDELNQGFNTSDGCVPKGFEIAGSDKIFQSANALIKGDEIIVWNDTISNPKYIRYGWSDNPQLNLYNLNEMPFTPFEHELSK